MLKKTESRLYMAGSVWILLTSKMHSNLASFLSYLAKDAVQAVWMVRELLQKYFPILGCGGVALLLCALNVAYYF